MINDIKKIFISFCAGLGIGVVSGKIYYEKKYRMKLQGATFKSDAKDMASTEAKEEVKEESKEAVEERDPKESSEINKNKDDLSTMAKKVQDENPRIDYSTPSPNEKKEAVDPEPSIEEDFVIEPEDFGDLAEEDVEVVRLLWLADNHLVYENGNEVQPVEEPQKKIGKKALEILRDEDAQDVLYVRNKRIGIDYEIVRVDDTLNERVSDEDDEDEENFDED